jgi:hypothetical protein
MSITRRLFLSNTAAVGAVGAAIAAPAPAEAAQPPLTPDERIEAAIEEIKAAYLEKWPDAPINITDCDNIDNGMVIIVTHCANDKPGAIKHRRIGLARGGERI